MAEYSVGLNITDDWKQATAKLSAALSGIESQARTALSGLSGKAASTNINQTTSALERLRTQLNNVNSIPLKVATKAEARQAVTGLNSISASLGRLHREGKITTDQLRTMNAEVARSNTAWVAQKAALGGASKEMNAMDAAFERINARVKQFASFILAAMIIRGFSQAVRGTASVIIEFDQALYSLQAITRANTHEARLMGDAILDVARKTKFSAGEVAAGMELIGRAGFSAAESIHSIEAVANLATGTLESFEDVVDLMTTTMRAFHMESVQASEISDVFANAINNSKLTVDKLSTAFNYVGAASYQAGLTLNETTGSLMLLANAGVRASTMGTGLRRTFLNLLNPNQRLRDALHSVGMEIDDMNPRMVGWEQVLRNVTGLIYDFEEGAVDMGLAASFFGARAAQAVAVLVDAVGSGGALTMAIESTREIGAAARMAALQQEGLANQFKNLQDRTKLVAIAMGDAGLNGVISAVVNNLRDFMETLEDLFRHNKAFTEFVAIGTSIVVITAAVAALGAALKYVKPLLLAIIVMMKSPIVLAIAAFVAATTAARYFADRTEKLAQAHEKAAIEILGSVDAIESWTRALNKAATVGDRQYLDTIRRYIEQNEELSGQTLKIINEHELLGATVSRTWEQMMAGTKDLEHLNEIVNKAFEIQKIQAFEEGINKLTNTLKIRLKEIDNIIGRAEGVHGGIEGYMQLGRLDPTEFLDNLKKDLDRVEQEVTRLVESIAIELARVVTTTEMTIEDALALVKDVVSDKVFANIETELKSILDNTSNTIKALRTELLNRFGNLPEEIKAQFKDLSLIDQAAFMEELSKIDKAIEEIKERIVEYNYVIGDIDDATLTAALEAERIKRAAEAIEKFGDATDDAGEAAKKFQETLNTSVKSYKQQIILLGKSERETAKWTEAFKLGLKAIEDLPPVLNDAIDAYFDFKEAADITETFKKVKKSLEDSIKESKAQILQLKIGEKEYSRYAMLLEAGIDINKDLTDTEKERFKILNKLWLQQQEMNDELEYALGKNEALAEIEKVLAETTEELNKLRNQGVDDIEKQIWALMDLAIAYELEYDAIKDAHEALLDLRKEREEPITVPDPTSDLRQQTTEMERIWDQMLRNIQSANAATFREMMDDGIDSWESLGDRIIDIMKDTLAQILAMYAQQYIVMNIVPQYMGGGAGGSLMQSMGFEGPGGATDSSGTRLPSSRAINWTQQNVPGMGWLGSTIPKTGPIGMPAAYASHPAYAAGPGQPMGATWGGAIGAGAIAGMGYQYLGGALGLPQSQYSGLTAGVGGALGSAAGSYMAGAAGGALGGAKAGSVVPVIGTIIGAVIGGLLGSLAGGDSERRGYIRTGTGDRDYIAGMDSPFGGETGLYDWSRVGGKSEIQAPAQGMYDIMEHWDKMIWDVLDDTAQEAFEDFGYGGSAGRKRIKHDYNFMQGIVRQYYRRVFEHSDDAIFDMLETAHDQVWDAFKDDPDQFFHAFGSAIQGITYAFDSELENLEEIIDRIDFTNVEQALSDLYFAVGFEDTVAALASGIEEMRQQIDAAAEQEVAGLIAGLEQQMETTERLGLDTEALTEAQQEYVKSLVLGRETMTEAEAELYALEVRFKEFEKALIAVGYSAEEAADIAAEGWERAKGEINAAFEMDWLEKFNPEEYTRRISESDANDMRLVIGYLNDLGVTVSDGQGVFELFNAVMSDANYSVEDLAEYFGITTAEMMEFYKWLGKYADINLDIKGAGEGFVESSNTFRDAVRQFSISVSERGEASIADLLAQMNAQGEGLTETRKLDIRDMMAAFTDRPVNLLNIIGNVNEQLNWYDRIPWDAFGDLSTWITENDGSFAEQLFQGHLDRYGLATSDLERLYGIFADMTDLPDLMQDGKLNTDALSEWFDTIRDISAEDLQALYGDEVTSQLQLLLSLQEEYNDLLEDQADQLREMFATWQMGFRGETLLDSFDPGEFSLDEWIDWAKVTGYDRFEEVAEQWGYSVEELMEIMGLAAQETARLEQEMQSAVSAYIGALQEELRILETAYNDARQALDQAINQEQRLADARLQAADSLDQLINRLLGGKQAPVQSMEYHENRYQELLSAAHQAETPEEISKAISALTGFAPEYLDFMAAYGGDYLSVYDDVMDDLASLETELRSEAQIQIDHLDSIRKILDDTDDTVLSIEDALKDYQDAKTAFDESWMHDELEYYSAMLESSQTLEELQLAAIEAIIAAGLDHDIIQGTDLEGHAWTIKDSPISGEMFTWDKGGPRDITRAFADGGIATGPTSGYPAMLHGTEAIIPLNNGYIPIEIKGADSPEIARAVGLAVSQAMKKQGNIQVTVKIGERELHEITTDVIRTDTEAQHQIRRVTNGR